MKLPTNKTEPTLDIGSLNILLYGAAKIGKSTFAAHAPDALFLATERGHGAMSIYKVDIDNWKELREALGEIKKGEHNYKTIVIDTIDNAYEMCREYILDELKIKHEQDMPYGKAYSAIRDEFGRVFDKTLNLPYGVIWIGHTAIEKIELKTGIVDKITVNLPSKIKESVMAHVDAILYAELFNFEKEGDIEKRVVRTRPMLEYDAGVRKLGQPLPDPLPLDYEALANAYRDIVEKETQIENNNTETKENKNE